MPDVFMYKIRRLSDGLFSKGGNPPVFSNQGKMWSSKRALSSHFALLVDGPGPVTRAYQGCEVVEFSVSEVGTSPAPEHLERALERKGQK